MLIAIIPIKTFESAQALINQASAADLFEFRLDYLPQVELQNVAKLQHLAQKPVMFTLRKPDQGGVYPGSESERFHALLQWMTLKPDYLDLEHDVPIDLCQQIKAISPDTQFVRSFHDFHHTPDDLPKILQAMQDPLFSYYKIITTAQTINDTLRVLQFVKDYAAQLPLTAHAMGELGITSRILGRVLGNQFTYASVSNDNNVAPGLLTLDELTQVYHYSALNTHTKIYGLIGDPIAHSIGHLFHNAEFIAHKQNAVYVKFHVKPEELAEFFSLTATLPLAGLSVTMPHKQAVLNFCHTLTDEVATIGAANTLIKQPEGYLAANTDGEAVMNLLPQQLAGKKIVVIGAGGAASSIIYSLIKKGAIVSVYNRSPNSAAALKEKYPIEIFPLEDIKHADYDMLINTLPVKAYPHPIRFIKDKIVFDANYQNTPTDLIIDALLQGCITIEGKSMFYAQAQMQRDLWFNPHE
ncbi:MAG TPA: type I 3-dehydroquinate dehydratase [Gammaproteobacteria bacterium]|nr:type I 3-dehydroquinate dehydratase [Gammaproteobacteria bacterium]